jgi:hypothetical protein
MNTNAQGCAAAEPWSITAANENFLDADATPDAHVSVHAGWDPYAAWRARVKAMFSLQTQSESGLLT